MDRLPGARIAYIGDGPYRYAILPFLLPMIIINLSLVFSFMTMTYTCSLIWSLCRPELEKMFAGMPAVFTGMLHGEELSQAYASGDVFVMPSESETLGLVVLEAMSSGVPVVAARAGGIPDIIPKEQEGKTSFLFTPGDIDDCVNKIERLLSCEEFRVAMGKAAREEMEKCDWRASTLKIRNEQYNAAIWFWRKKRAQLLRPFQWLVKKFRSQQIKYV